MEQLMAEVVSSINGPNETELEQSAGQGQQSGEKLEVEERVPKESRRELNYDTEPVKMHDNFGEEDEPSEYPLLTGENGLNETEFAQAAGQGQQSAEKRKMEEHVPKESRREQNDDTEPVKMRDKSRLRLATIALNQTEFARAAGLKNDSAEKREVGGDRAPKESHRLQKHDTEPVELGLDNDGEGEPGQPDYDGKTGNVGDELPKAVTKLGPSLEDELEELGEDCEEEQDEEEDREES